MSVELIAEDSLSLLLDCPVKEESMDLDLSPYSTPPGSWGSVKDEHDLIFDDPLFNLDLPSTALDDDNFFNWKLEDQNTELPTIDFQQFDQCNLGITEENDKCGYIANNQYSLSNIRPTQCALPQEVNYMQQQQQAQPQQYNGIVSAGYLQDQCTAPLHSEQNQQQVPDLIEELMGLTNPLTPPESPETCDQKRETAVFSIMQDLVLPINDLDQLVASRVEDFACEEGVTSGGDFNSSSCSSSPCRSTSGTEDDPEWVPSNFDTRPPAPGPDRRKKKTHKEHSEPDKKERKKGQNRDAATRYRMKKKKEAEVIVEDEKKELERNKTLRQEKKKKIEELNLLKSLLRDAFRLKGLIK